jgi:hypothetical protein
MPLLGCSSALTLRKIPSTGCKALPLYHLPLAAASPRSFTINEAWNGPHGSARAREDLPLGLLVSARFLTPSRRSRSNFAVANLARVAESFVIALRSITPRAIRERTMTTNTPTQVATIERRALRRFDMHLPALIRNSDRFQEFITETLNISARGVFFYIEGRIAPHTRIEVTLTLPSQVTVSDSVRVRFTGRVLRVESGPSTRTGVAAAIEEYEFLRTPELSAFNSDLPISGPSFE